MEEKVDSTLDRLLVEFGKEILQIVPGKVSTEVDARFSFDVEGSINKALHIIDVGAVRLQFLNLILTDFIVVQVHWHRQVTDSHQARFNMGGHQGSSRTTIQAWRQLQSYPHVLPTSSYCCS